MELRKGRHCVSCMHAHLVFVTKYRGKVFNKKHLDFIQTVFQDICSIFEAELKEFNGEQDHVHMLIEYPPKVAVAKLVNSLKGVSSRYLRKEFTELKKFKSLWSPSYFSGSCGGAPIKILKEYIENQKK